MNIRFASIALASVTALAPAQTPAGSISFTNPGARLSSLLPELGKVAGIRLEAATTMAGEPLVIRVKDVALPELLAKIADAAGGEWTKIDGGYRLGRSSDLANRQTRDEMAHRAELISQALAERMQSQEMNRPFDDAAAARLAASLPNPEKMQAGNVRRSTGNWQNEAPGTRAIIRLLALLAPNHLAIDEGQRVVFSTSPTAMQRSLSGKSSSVLTAFIREQALFAKAAATPGDEPGRTVMINGISPLMGPGNAALGIGKGLLSVVGGPGGSLSAKLTVFDANGVVLSTATTFLSVSAPVNPTKSGDAAEPAISLSETAREFASLGGQGGSGGARVIAVAIAADSVGGSGGGPATDATVAFNSNGPSTKKASAALRAKLLHPEEVDPISLTFGEGLVTAAERAGRNLVADAPDGAVTSVMQWLVRGVKPSLLLGQMDKLPDIVATDSSGWWTLRPELRISSRTNRINRTALGTFVRAIAANSAVRLIDAGDFAALQSKPLRMDDLDGYLAGNADPGVSNDDLTQLTMANWNTLRIYGMLSLQQRQALLNGTPLPFSALSSQQRDVLSQDYYNQSGGLQFMGGGQMSVSESRGRAGARAASIPGQEEPTEVLPAGLPNNGTLQVMAQDQPAVRARASATGLSRIMNMASLALLNSLESRPGEGEELKKPSFDQFQPARQTRYTFRFTLSPTVTFNRFLTDSSVVDSAGPGPWDALPAPLREAYDRVAKTFGTVRIGTGRSSTSP